VVHVLVDPEAAVVDADVARVAPVGDEHVVVGQQRLHRGAQERREVARQRGDHEYAGLGDVGVLREAQQAAERRLGDGLLAHGHPLAGHGHRVDPERRARVGQRRARDDVRGGVRRAPKPAARRARRQGPERPGAERRERAGGGEQVALGVVRLVQHSGRAACCR